MSLSCPISEISSIICQNLKRSRDQDHTHFRNYLSIWRPTKWSNDHCYWKLTKLILYKIEVSSLSHDILQVLNILNGSHDVTTPLSGTFEFCRDLWQQKTTVSGLACGTECMILCLVVLVEHWLVTDGQRHDVSIYRASTAQHRMVKLSHTTHTQPFYCSSGICPGPPGWAGTRKVKARLKPIWIYWSKR